MTGRIHTIEGWNVAKGVSFMSMFERYGERSKWSLDSVGDGILDTTAPDLSKWRMASATDVRKMFQR